MHDYTSPVRLESPAMWPRQLNHAISKIPVIQTCESFLASELSLLRTYDQEQLAMAMSREMIERCERVL